MTVEICPCFLNDDSRVQVVVEEKSAPPCENPSSNGAFTVLRKIRIKVKDGWKCWELKDVECTGTGVGDDGTVTDTYSILHLFKDAGDGWKESNSSMYGASFDMTEGCGADTSGADRPFDSVRKAGGGFDWTTTGIRLVFARTVAGLVKDSSTGRLWTDGQGNLYRG